VSLITEEYRKQNAELHRTTDAFGTSSYRWAEMVEKIARQMQCRTLLDYGAGKQTLGIALGGKLNYTAYDPAIPDISEPPDPADLVICTDVLEHIEPECLEDVLADLRRLTLKACFLVVGTRPAIKLLPDGRNAHLIVENGHWWIPRLMKHWSLRVVNNIAGELVFVGKTEDI
jgi:hypothetical protein